MRWIESGEIAREFESAAVFWFRDRKSSGGSRSTLMTPP
jgi:hypothetical protein